VLPGFVDSTQIVFGEVQKLSKYEKEAFVLHRVKKNNTRNRTQETTFAN
jgi:hypothetical protein